MTTKLAPVKAVWAFVKEGAPYYGALLVSGAQVEFPATASTPEMGALHTVALDLNNLLIQCHERSKTPDPQPTVTVRKTRSVGKSTSAPLAPAVEPSKPTPTDSVPVSTPVSTPAASPVKLKKGCKTNWPSF